MTRSSLSRKALRAHLRQGRIHRPLGPKLDADTFVMLRDRIAEYSGIFLPAGFRFLLERRLRPRLLALGCATFDEYMYILKKDAFVGNEIQEIVERVATGETYFLRERSQLQVLCDDILPKMIAARSKTQDGAKKQPIRIWSAGCSTGEEPYSLAMMITQRRAWDHAMAQADIEILGSDICKNALALAQEGRYRGGAFRQLSREMRDTFFSRSQSEWVLDASIRNMVQFECANLFAAVDAHRLAAWDIVLCRNVMIYFKAWHRQRLLTYFFDHIRPGGVLCLGRSEMISDPKSDFDAELGDGDVVYRKPCAKDCHLQDPDLDEGLNGR